MIPAKLFEAILVFGLLAAMGCLMAIIYKNRPPDGYRHANTPRDRHLYGKHQ